MQRIRSQHDGIMLASSYTRVESVETIGSVGKAVWNTVGSEWILTLHHTLQTGILIPRGPTDQLRQDMTDRMHPEELDHHLELHG